MINFISRCRDLTLPLIKGKICEIISFDHSDRQYSLKFKLPGFKRPPIQSYGIIPRQAWGNVPAGETFIAPLEDSADGDYLVSGAVGTEKIRKGKEALLRFERGRLVHHHYLNSMNPVSQLVRLQKIAEASGQGHCWTTIAEFGIGVNKAIRRLVGVQLVDEKKYGTVHIAIGHNIGWPTMAVEPLTPLERESLIVDYLGRHAKQLDAPHRRRIVAAPQTGNGLYLSTLLNELRLFGRHEELGQRIGWYLEAAAPFELYGKVIQRWEKDYEE